MVLRMLEDNWVLQESSDWFQPLWYHDTLNDTLIRVAGVGMGKESKSNEGSFLTQSVLRLAKAQQAPTTGWRPASPWKWGHRGGAVSWCLRCLR